MMHEDVILAACFPQQGRVMMRKAACTETESMHGGQMKMKEFLVRLQISSSSYQKGWRHRH